jgi:toxin ParE1/3/4
MPSYFLTGPAEDDLTEILSYIATDNLAAAASMYYRFHALFEMLADAPEAGRRREELRFELRSFAEGNYTVFYRIVSETVEIVRVLHAARDIDSLFEP